MNVGMPANGFVMPNNVWGLACFPMHNCSNTNINEQLRRECTVYNANPIQRLSIKHTNMQALLFNNQREWNFGKSRTIHFPDEDGVKHINHKGNHVNSSLPAVTNSDHELSSQTLLEKFSANARRSLAFLLNAVVTGLVAVGIYAKSFSYLFSLANTAVCVATAAITGAGIGAYTGGAAGCIYGASVGRVVSFGASVGRVVFAGGVTGAITGALAGAITGAVIGALAGAVTGSVARGVCSFFAASSATTTAITTIASSIASGVGGIGGGAGAGVVAGAVATAVVSKVATGSTTAAAVTAAVTAACTCQTAFVAVVAAVVAGCFWYWRNRQG
jgi:hypothetical protein